MWTSLIGFMGSGKSRLAAAIGERAILPVVDVDAEIVRRAGRPVGEIFAVDGEAAFRDLETAVLQDLGDGDDLVVASGGGVVERAEAVASLRKNGPVIWLDVPWEALRRRLAGDREAGVDRPLVENLGWDGLHALFLRRRPLYAAAADFRLRGDLVGPEALSRRALACRLAWSRQRREAS